MIKQGDRIIIKPEWRDRDDNNFVWIACCDEDKGRVIIAPVNTTMAIAPHQTVTVDMLESRAKFAAAQVRKPVVYLG